VDFDNVSVKDGKAAATASRRISKPQADNIGTDAVVAAVRVWR
jgi:hypothetical protein